MPITDPEVWPTRNIVRTSVILLAALFAASAFAQAPAASPVTPTAYSLGFLDPLPQDTGASGLKLELRKLQTTSRLMMVVAHPDDEDGGLLTYEARGKGVQTLLMTLTRGEGGQNKTGDTFSDELGILRTLELLAADRYYGVEQRFSRVADFGYSKTAEETFQKWGGHDVPLADIVRVIRQFRPDVLIARFSGTERDGHGHHQASAILTKEAFRAAADPKRFPEQIKEGLLPWQPKKLYIGNVCGFGASTCADENYTVKINTGEEDPVLGMTYFQFAIEGLRHQESQGLGDLKFPPGPRYAFYKLEDSVIPNTKDDKGHEKDLFDGINTSLPALASNAGFGTEWLAPELRKVSDDIEQANESEPSAASKPILDAFNRLNSSAQGMKNGTSHQSVRKNALVDLLWAKESEANRALSLALGISVEARMNGTGAASPGEEIKFTVWFHNGSQHDLLTGYGGPLPRLDLPVDAPHLLVRAGQYYSKEFSLRIPEFANRAYTRPYWHRQNPASDTVNVIDKPQYATLPFSWSPFQEYVSYSEPHHVAHDNGPTGGVPWPTISAPLIAETQTGSEKAKRRQVSIVPAFSVAIEPVQRVIPVGERNETTVKVAVSTNVGTAPGKLRLEVPEGWRVDPEQLTVSPLKAGDERAFIFRVSPGSLSEGRSEIHAILDAGGKTYSEGYTLVTREDLGSFYYFEPAAQRISIVDVKVPKDLKVGYIMGAGDDIPTVLQQIGMNVTLIPAGKITTTDLSSYGTIVLGVRAYDTHKDLVTNNQKLLDFVSNGGTLVVQNNNSIGDFNSEHLTPYPAELSRARVSVEEAPVQILAPDNPVFHFPNEITQKDFDNWVQERGLYFMSSWDSKFTPLLSCHDPGEPDQKGGMLEAKYGKGTYIFTGYAFFRQLPAGVPGAVRLFVNLVSAGHEGSH